MYKQIIETCEEPLAFKKKYMDADLSEYYTDKVMLERSKDITERLLSGGMNIDKIFALVSNFQQKYIHLDKCDKNASKHFTVEIWSKMLSENC